MKEYKESKLVAKEMESADSWCHLSGKVLKIGRCTNPPKPEAEEETKPDAANIQSKHQKHQAFEGKNIF